MRSGCRCHVLIESVFGSIKGMSSTIMAVDALACCLFSPAAFTDPIFQIPGSNAINVKYMSTRFIHAPCESAHNVSCLGGPTAGARKIPPVRMSLR
jgi:hypothetical protein